MLLKNYRLVSLNNQLAASHQPPCHFPAKKKKKEKNLLRLNNNLGLKNRYLFISFFHYKFKVTLIISLLYIYNKVKYIEDMTMMDERIRPEQLFKS